MIFTLERERERSNISERQSIEGLVCHSLVPYRFLCTYSYDAPNPKIMEEKRWRLKAVVSNFFASTYIRHIVPQLLLTTNILTSLTSS